MVNEYLAQCNVMLCNVMLGGGRWDVMVANCNEPEWPTAPGVSPATLDLLYIFLKPFSTFFSIQTIKS